MKKFVLLFALMMIPALALAQDKTESKPAATTAKVPTPAEVAAAAAATKPAVPFVYVPDRLDVVVGDAKAPVTIVEYASLSCPHCAHFYNDLFPEMKKEYIDTGKAKLVFRHFPLNGPAVRGALVVSCVAPAKREAFLKVLFSMQEKWAFDADPKEALANIAGVGGLDRKEFDACQDNKALEEEILAGVMKADKNKWVSSTPTFYIGDKKIEGVEAKDVFAQAINKVLLAKKKK